MITETLAPASGGLGPARAALRTNRLAVGRDARRRVPAIGLEINHERRVRFVDVLIKLTHRIYNIVAFPS